MARVSLGEKEHPELAETIAKIKGARRPAYALKVDTGGKSAFSY